MKPTRTPLQAALLATLVSTFISVSVNAQGRGSGDEGSGGGKTATTRAADPGVRHTTADNGPPVPLTGLAADELAFFQDGLARFAIVEVVSGAVSGNGLGPTFNSNQCSSCHSQPYIGGSSPAKNPLLQVAHAGGATNSIPWFEAENGPIREARFVKSNGVYDGGVHNTFVVTGRSDAGSCSIQQPNFAPAGNPVTGLGGNPNVVFRIPTPIMGGGLIEAIPDSVILANMRASAARNSQVGVHGRANAVQGGNTNFSANDGTIARFGWKAQNKSLLMFSGEAYNVEMGITNTLFPTERNETPECRPYDVTPEDYVNLSAATPAAVLSDIEAFSNFMRMLAPPVPAPATASTTNGRARFVQIGCAACHTPTLTTGKAVASGSQRSPSPALSNQSVNLFSDLLVHHMGTGLADGITQGAAGPDEFRTAPLWGLGQRIYFLHDGRTSDLVATIRAHDSQGSEASQVVQQYLQLDAGAQQDILNFLRSL